MNKSRFEFDFGRAIQATAVKSVDELKASSLADSGRVWIPYGLIGADGKSKQGHTVYHIRLTSGMEMFVECSLGELKLLQQLAGNSEREPALDWSFLEEHDRERERQEQLLRVILKYRCTVCGHEWIGVAVAKPKCEKCAGGAIRREPRTPST